MSTNVTTTVTVSCDNPECKERLQIRDCGSNITKALGKARGEKNWLVKVNGKNSEHFCPACREQFQGKPGRKKINLESLPQETREDLEAERYFASL